MLRVKEPLLARKCLLVSLSLLCLHLLSSSGTASLFIRSTSLCTSWWEVDMGGGAVGGSAVWKLAWVMRSTYSIWCRSTTCIALYSARWAMSASTPSDWSSASWAYFLSGDFLLGWCAWVLSSCPGICGFAAPVVSDAWQAVAGIVGRFGFDCKGPLHLGPCGCLGGRVLRCLVSSHPTLNSFR